MIREVWTIELGIAVGPFRLGASIAEALHALKVCVCVLGSGVRLALILVETDPWMDCCTEPDARASV